MSASHETFLPFCEAVVYFSSLASTRLFGFVDWEDDLSPPYGFLAVGLERQIKPGIRVHSFLCFVLSVFFFFFFFHPSPYRFLRVTSYKFKFLYDYVFFFSFFLFFFFFFWSVKWGAG